MKKNSYILVISLLYILIVVLDNCLCKTRRRVNLGEEAHEVFFLNSMTHSGGINSDFVDLNVYSYFAKTQKVEEVKKRWLKMIGVGGVEVECLLSRDKDGNFYYKKNGPILRKLNGHFIVLKFNQDHNQYQYVYHVQFFDSILPYNLFVFYVDPKSLKAIMSKSKGLAFDVSHLFENCDRGNLESSLKEVIIKYFVDYRAKKIAKMKEQGIEIPPERAVWDFSAEWLISN